MAWASPIMRASGRFISLKAWRVGALFRVNHQKAYGNQRKGNSKKRAAKRLATVFSRRRPAKAAGIVARII